MRCVTVEVERCRYAVRDKETIADVASLFATDWAQLWSLNPAIREPDYDVGFALGSILNTGHKYRVDSGDYLAAIANKFGTTLKQLIMLNADLASGANEGLEVSTSAVRMSDCGKTWMTR